ncbi:GHKL domain-containing protein [Limosilactobacillus sp.]|uniref:GHKL domain-containing protein n=1 Tax=Limosilactobacillus sp. TaxID=2773925 RepID=UPI003F0DAFCA
MIYFNLINPFTLTPSISYLIGWIIKDSVFYPIFLLGTYNHLQPQRLPWYFYLIIGIGALFLPFYFLLNDLIWIIITIMLAYLWADHGNGSLTNLVASFGYSMLIYYFTQASVPEVIQTLKIVHLLRLSTDVAFFLASVILLICYGVALIIILLTRNFFHQYLTRLQNNHPLTEWLFSMAFLPLCYFLYYTHYNKRLMLPPILPESASPLADYLAYLAVVIGYFVVVLILMSVTSKYLANRDRVIITEHRLANLAKYTSQLEVMTDDLRRFRHDYQNILYSLTSALETNNLDYAKRALNHLTRATQRSIKVPTGIIGPLKNIADPGIKAVVFNKISTAMDKGLNLEVEIADPIKLTQALQQVDAIRIITILFDNAIKAAENSEKKLINFSLYENQFAQFIVVGNSTAEEKVDLARLTAIAHTVTLGKNHHLGLRNLQIILARYPRISNDRSAKNHYFEQRIIIPKK